MLICLTSLMLSLVGPVKAQQVDSVTWANSQMPPFDVATAWLNSLPVTHKDLIGKVVLIHFFAPWCSSCLGEIKGLVQIDSEYRKKGVVVLGVILPYHDSLSARKSWVANFLQKQRVTYPVAIDSTMRMGDYSPENRLLDNDVMIFDQSGKLRFITGNGRPAGNVFFTNLIRYLLGYQPSINAMI